MDGRHDELALSLVAEACIAVEHVAFQADDALARLEWLRAELQSVAYCCGDEAAREALLAVELIDDVLQAQPMTAALAS